MRDVLLRLLAQHGNAQNRGCHVYVGQDRRREALHVSKTPRRCLRPTCRKVADSSYRTFRPIPLTKLIFFIRPEPALFLQVGGETTGRPRWIVDTAVAFEGSEPSTNCDAWPALMTKRSRRPLTRPSGWRKRFQTKKTTKQLEVSGSIEWCDALLFCLHPSRGLCLQFHDREQFRSIQESPESQFKGLIVFHSEAAFNKS